MAHVQRLLPDVAALSAEAPISSFYFRSRADAIDKLPFLPASHCFSLSDKSLTLARGECEELLQKYHGQNLLPAHTAAINTSRRLYASAFRHAAAPLQKAVQQFIGKLDSDAKPTFHIVSDGTQPADTGILTELLAMLRHESAVADIFVYLFYHEKKLTDHQAASWYATLLEAHTATTHQARFSLFPFHDNASLAAEQQSCACQIFHTAVASANVAFKAPTEDSGSLFLRTAELAISIDRNKMQTLLARQITVNMLGRMAGDTEHSAQPVIPLWVNELFSDKKWLLHADFLSMEQDFFATRSVTYSSIEREWASRAQFFLEKVDEDSEWNEQISSMASSLENVYRKLFRGQGVELFYAVNESGLTAIAQRIVAQMESELAKNWCEGKCSLAHMPDIGQKIVAVIDTRLSACRNRRQQQGELAKSLLQEHQTTISNWQEAGRGERRKIQKNYSVADAAHHLERYYIADCHAKAMTFACRLLLAVIAELDNVQNRVDQIREYITAQVDAATVQAPSTEIQATVATRSEEVWKLSGEANWLSLMPKEFAASLDNLYEMIHADCIATIKPEEGFAGIEKELSKPELSQEITQKIMAQHPIFRPEKFTAAENIFFWHLLPQLTLQVQAALQRLDQVQPHTDDTQQTWLMPPNPDNKKLPATIAADLHRQMPHCQTLINVAMLFPCLLYRRTTTYALSALDGFKAWGNDYKRLLLGTNGAAHSLLLHTQNKTPYPEYETGLLPEPAPDTVRCALLTGELRGVVHEQQYNNGTQMVTLHVGGIHVPLGKNFPDAQTRMTPVRFELLRHAVSSTAPSTPLSEENRHTLNHRLDNIKMICLNGKTDIRRADWKEAGNYMPWARAVESLLAEK